MSDPSSSRFDPVALLLRRWRTAAVFGILGVAAGVAYLLVAPKWYAARLSVIPSQHSQEPGALGLAGKLSVGLDASPADVQRIQAVLTSVSVADEVIENFKLKDLYKASTQEAARDALWSHCTTGADRKSSVVTLSCEDQQPERAMAITNYFGDVGNRVFKRVSASSAREERAFLETQVAKARQDVDDTSRRLRTFQETNHLIDLPEQSKAVISAMASIQGDMLSKQLELSYLANFSARTEPTVVQLEQRIANLRSQLAHLEAATSLSEGSGSAVQEAQGSANFFPGAMEVPKLRFELEQLLREQKIQETLFFLLTQRYEMAKVDEARDTSTFQILDYPTLPSRPARPRRKKVLAVGGGLGLAMAAAWILVPAWWRRRATVAA